MKERLLQLLDLEQLSPSRFADIIGVQRSSVSHVISGRNNPSYDFLQKTLKAFPGLNAEWLMLGQGTMYEQMGRKPSDTLFDSSEAAPTPSKTDVPAATETVDPAPPGEDEEADKNISFISSGKTADLRSAGGLEIQGTPSGSETLDLHQGTRRIVKVVLFYNDDTFTSFDPS